MNKRKKKRYTNAYAHGARCPYCGGTVGLRIAPNDDPCGGYIWQCNDPDCRAQVHCVSGSTMPLGTLSARHDGSMRRMAHNSLDRLIASGMSRAEAYVWMQDTLHISAKNAHIGQMSAWMCQRIIDEVDYHLRTKQSA